MSSGRNKYQSREDRARLRELFMREWDPIGVADIPAAADEYDTYIARAYVMLMDESADQQAIAEYLFDIACRYMELGNSQGLRERCDRTAELMIALKPSFLLN
jgi:hypothetical protein